MDYFSGRGDRSYRWMDCRLACSSELGQINGNFRFRWQASRKRSKNADTLRSEVL
jgi:hypothetical protein